MTHAELRDKTKELKSKVGPVRKSFNQCRRALGQLFDEMRTRIAEAGGRLVIQEGEPAVNWDDYCTSIGENRRSASLWADNWRTYRDAASNLQTAAEEADIDLFQPRTAKILRAINQELNGGSPSESEIPALLDRLDPSDEPKREAAKASKRKSGNKRRKPVPAPTVTAPQPTRPESVVALMDVNLDFFKRNPSIPMEDVYRPLFHSHLRIFPLAMGVAHSETIAAILQIELGFLREQLNNSSAPAKQTPESSVEQSAGVLSQSSAVNAEPLSVPTVARAFEAIADPLGKAQGGPPLPPGLFGVEDDIDDGGTDDADIDDKNVDEEECVEGDDIDEADVEEDDVYEEVDMEEDELLEELPSFAVRRPVAGEYFEAAQVFFEATDL